MDNYDDDGGQVRAIAFMCGHEMRRVFSGEHGGVLRKKLCATVAASSNRKSPGSESLSAGLDSVACTLQTVAEDVVSGFNDLQQLGQHAAVEQAEQYKELIRLLTAGRRPTGKQAQLGLKAKPLPGAPKRVPKSSVPPSEKRSAKVNAAPYIKVAPGSSAASKVSSKDAPVRFAKLSSMKSIVRCAVAANLITSLDREQAHLVKAKKDKDVFSMMWLYDHYTASSDQRNAMAWLKNAMRENNPKAAFILSQKKFNENSFSEANNFLRMAAKLGHPDAKRMISELPTMNQLDNVTPGAYDGFGTLATAPAQNDHKASALLDTGANTNTRPICHEMPANDPGGDISSPKISKASMGGAAAPISNGDDARSAAMMTPMVQPCSAVSAELDYSKTLLSIKKALQMISSPEPIAASTPAVPPADEEALSNLACSPDIMSLLSPPPNAEAVLAVKKMDAMREARVRHIEQNFEANLPSLLKSSTKKATGQSAASESTWVGSRIEQVETMRRRLSTEPKNTSQLTAGGLSPRSATPRAPTIPSPSIGGASPGTLNELRAMQIPSDYIDQFICENTLSPKPAGRGTPKAGRRRRALAAISPNIFS